MSSAGRVRGGELVEAGKLPSPAVAWTLFQAGDARPAVAAPYAKIGLSAADGFDLFSGLV
jgi:hypothetical protein